ncbi:hypothetical protein ACWGE0_20245 [Lentzea sp. NPDC054927]
MKIFSEISRSASTSVSESWSNTSARTISACEGAAASIADRPWSVSTTNDPRPSLLQFSLRTSPRFSIRAT